MLLKRPTQALLSDKTFFIEFQGYLTNHVKHAIVALEKLNAPPERLQEYWDQYTKVTPYNLEVEANPLPFDQVQPTTRQEWKELRGKKEKWQEMCSFLEVEKETKHGGDVKSLVKEFAPDLLDGIAGGLTHGIIHLGWGIDAQNDWMTVEGLSYLNYCNIGVDQSKMKEEAIEEDSPLESMLRIAKEFKSKDLGSKWIEKSKAQLGEDFHPELIPAGFQWNLAKVLATPHSVATDLPTWLNKKPLPMIWKELYHLCTLVYLATKDSDGHGNFLILHSITSLWGLEKVCAVIDDEKVERKALNQFFSSLVCLLSTSSGGFPSADELNHTHEKYPLENRDDKNAFDWAPTVAAALKEEEEHNIKLAYVTKELWNRYDYWHGFSEAGASFTLTPNIGPSTTDYKA